MRQIGTGILMYVSENQGTYPPVWCPIDPNNAGNNNQYSGATDATGAAANGTYVTEIARYLGSRETNLYLGLKLPVFACPNDTNTVRDTFLNSTAVLSYTMPRSFGPDLFHLSDRWRTKNDRFGASAGTWYNRGIGQTWTPGNGYPLVIRTNMVHPASKVLLLVERSYSEEAQCTNWNLGYYVDNPGQQMYDPNSLAVYGLPLLHTDIRKRSPTVTITSAGKNVAFNYLFCDDHVEFLSPRETVSNTPKGLSTCLPGQVEGGDYMWTIMPELYSN
jgi:hypothetical protein